MYYAACCYFKKSRFVLEEFANDDSLNDNEMSHLDTRSTDIQWKTCKTKLPKH